MTNPENRKHMAIVHDRFPEHSLEELKKFIWDTAEILEDARKKSQSSTAELRVYFYDGTLNYSLVRIDNEIVVFSAYEQFRERRIGNSAIILDLQESEPLRQFFEKEIAGFLRDSVHVDIP